MYGLSNRMWTVTWNVVDRNVYDESSVMMSLCGLLPIKCVEFFSVKLHTVIYRNYHIRLVLFLAYTHHDLRYNCKFCWTPGEQHRGTLGQNAIDIIIHSIHCRRHKMQP